MPGGRIGGAAPRADVLAARGPRHHGGRGGEGDPEAAEPCPCPALVREPKTESARVAPGVNGGNDQLTVRKSSPSNI